MLLTAACPPCTSLQVVYTAGALMRVTVVATKHQQLMEQRSASELQSSVTNVRLQQQQQQLRGSRQISLVSPWSLLQCTCSILH